MCSHTQCTLWYFYVGTHGKRDKYHFIYKMLYIFLFGRDRLYFSDFSTIIKINLLNDCVLVRTSQLETCTLWTVVSPSKAVWFNRTLPVKYLQGFVNESHKAIICCLELKLGRHITFGPVSWIFVTVPFLFILCLTLKKYKILFLN